MSSALFSLDVADGRARAGRLLLPQGEVETPVFMPVGTLGSVKGLAPEELADAGYRFYSYGDAMAVLR